tara:strand:- start:739 stop:1224 length:486 start_codon:yes stop_codon:yes gene_type:complete
MLKQAFDYKKWADECTLRAIESINKYAFPDSYAFALQQINHMVIVEELFKSRLTSTSPPHTSTNTDIVPGFEELENRLRESTDWFVSYVSELENGEEQIAFVFADGKRGMLNVEEILFHILNHGSYHRGNIAHALDLASVPHPIDGYGIYIHEIEPARRET